MHASKKQASRQAGKQASKQAGKQASKQASNQASRVLEYLMCKQGAGKLDVLEVAEIYDVLARS